MGRCFSLASQLLDSYFSKCWKFMHSLEDWKSLQSCFVLKSKIVVIIIPWTLHTVSLVFSFNCQVSKFFQLDLIWNRKFITNFGKRTVDNNWVLTKPNIWCKMALFKVPWRIFKVLPQVSPLGSFLLLLRAFKLVTVWSSTSKSVNNTTS